MSSLSSYSRYRNTVKKTPKTLLEMCCTTVCIPPNLLLQIYICVCACWSNISEEWCSIYAEVQVSIYKFKEALKQKHPITLKKKPYIVVFHCVNVLPHENHQPTKLSYHVVGIYWLISVNNVIIENNLVIFVRFILDIASQ